MQALEDFSLNLSNINHLSGFYVLALVSVNWLTSCLCSLSIPLSIVSSSERGYVFADIVFKTNWVSLFATSSSFSQLSLPRSVNILPNVLVHLCTLVRLVYFLWRQTQGLQTALDTGGLGLLVLRLSRSLLGFLSSFSLLLTFAVALSD